MAREPVFVDLLPSRVNVGLSSLIGITGLPGQIAVSLQWISGGTLEIVSSGASVGWGAGFPVPATTIFNFDCSGTFWLASSSATTSVGILRGRAQGFEGSSLGYSG